MHSDLEQQKVQDFQIETVAKMCMDELRGTYSTVSSFEGIPPYRSPICVCPGLRIHELQVKGIKNTIQNEINDCETEKHYYRTKLNSNHRMHTSELEEAFRVISEKNKMLMELEQRIERLKKEDQIMVEDCNYMRESLEAQRVFYGQEIARIRAQADYRAKQMKDEIEKEWQLKLNKAVADANQLCEQKIAACKKQMEEMGGNSQKLMQELKFMRNEYSNLLEKNNSIIQESINRELQKRQIEQQNKDLSSLSSYNNLKVQYSSLSAECQALRDQLVAFKVQEDTLNNKLQAAHTRSKDLEKAFEDLQNKHRKLQQALQKEYQDNGSNTITEFVPVVLPMDCKLSGEIVSMREFLSEKLMSLFLEFWIRTSASQVKKHSNSFTSFKNNFDQLVKIRPQYSLLLLFHSSLQRIVRLYCPALSYPSMGLQATDKFIRKALIECEAILDPFQKVYRLLELAHRLATQSGTVNASNSELKLVELKLILAVKKVLLVD